MSHINHIQRLGRLWFHKSILKVKNALQLEKQNITT